MLFTHACYAHSPSPSHVHMNVGGVGGGEGRNLVVLGVVSFLSNFFVIWDIVC